MWLIQGNVKYAVNYNLYWDPYTKIDFLWRFIIAVRDANTVQRLEETGCKLLKQDYTDDTDTLEHLKSATNERSVCQDVPLKSVLLCEFQIKICGKFSRSYSVIPLNLEYHT